MNYLQALVTDDRVFISESNGVYRADVVEENGDEFELCRALSVYEMEAELRAYGLL